MTTFKRPLQKAGGGKFESMFNQKGFKAVGDVYRDRLGGPPFPITRDAAPLERYFCNLAGCDVWRDEGNEWHGKCRGHCGCD